MVNLTNATNGRLANSNQLKKKSRIITIIVGIVATYCWTLNTNYKFVLIFL